jgi:hypothetical protein
LLAAERTDIRRLKLASVVGALRASITSGRLRSIHSDGVIALPKQYGHKKFIFLNPITMFVPVDGTPNGVGIIFPHVPHTAGIGMYGVSADTHIGYPLD